MANGPALLGRRVLLVVPPTQFDEAQLYQSWQLLTEEGAWLTLASDSETGIAVGSNGASERVSARLQDVDIRDYDAVVTIGTSGTGFDSRSLAELVVSLSRRDGTQSARPLGA